MLAVRDVETIDRVMADGVTLKADLYRPAGAGSYPVLVMRLPYGRKVASTVVLAHPAWYAAQGYVVLIEDVRGRGDSAGTFRILEDDVADGADTLSFAADLTGGNGQVASYGFSYHGMNQFMALAGARRAGTKAPDAMAVVMAAFDVRNHWAYEGDGFRLQSGQGWACQMAVENARHAGDLEAANALRAAIGSLHAGPVSARPDSLERLSRYTHYHDWLADDPAYWARVSPHSALGGLSLDVPVLHVGGWHDIMLEGTLSSFKAFCEQNDRQRLCIGPWSHIPWGRKNGTIDTGPATADGVDADIVAFFDETLKGRENPVPSIKLFDSGTKVWSFFKSLPETTATTLFLTSSGRAAPSSIDGQLVLQPAMANRDHLVHDPWRPAPAIGLHLGTPGAFADRAAIDDRSDVAVYTCVPLEKPMTVLGAPVVTLFVSCDRDSFDLDCTLSMVTPEGAAITVTSGHITLREKPSKPQTTVSLRPAYVTIPAGYGIRLSIQAAAFPAFAINPGTGARPQDAGVMDACVTTLVFHTGSETPSTLRLPVLIDRPAQSDMIDSRKEPQHGG